MTNCDTIKYNPVDAYFALIKLVIRLLRIMLRTGIINNLPCSLNALLVKQDTWPLGPI